MNGAGGVELEGSLSVQTLGDSLLGVVVLSEMEEAGWYAWGSSQGQKGLQAYPLLLLPSAGWFSVWNVSSPGRGRVSVGGESGSFGCEFYQVVRNRNLLLW